MTTPASWVSARLSPRVAGLRARLPGDAPCYALTFDDGPDPEFTPAVLDVLGELGAPATFFLVGERAEAHPDLVARMVAEGHGVGSHSHTHLNLRESAASAVESDLVRGRDAVSSAAGRPERRFRPPRGHLTWDSARIMRRAGLEPWLWTVETGDWRPDATVAGILAATAALAPGDVVLMHDALAGTDAPPGSEDRSRTVAALAGIVRHAAERGLRPVVVPG